jgi:ABC-type transport system substrate-binding protein
MTINNAQQRAVRKLVGRAAAGPEATTRWAAGHRASRCRLRTSLARYLSKEIPSDANRPRSQYRYSNPEIDKLFGQAASELDPEKRKAIYFKIQEVMRDEYQFIWLYNSTASWGLQTKVKNFDQTVKTPFGGFHWRAETWDIA